jgi:hypothetical protein
MHGYSKKDLGGSNRGPEAALQRRVRVYPRLSGAATECAGKPAPSENGDKVKKVTEKQRPFGSGHRNPIV